MHCTCRTTTTCTGRFVCTQGLILVTGATECRPLSLQLSLLCGLNSARNAIVLKFSIHTTFHKIAYVCMVYTKDITQSIIQNNYAAV